MLRLEEKNGYEVYYREKLIFKAVNTEPCVWLGQGSASYTMSHGAFKFKEQAKKLGFVVEEATHNEGQIVIKMVVDPAQSTSYDSRVTGPENEELRELELHHQFYIHMEERDGYVNLTFHDVPDYINRVYMRFPLRKEEKLYGGGEQFAKWNLRGEKVRIWVSEHIPLSSLIKKNIKKVLRSKKNKLSKFRRYATYMVVPTFISSDKKWIHVQSTDYMDFDFENESFMEVEIRGIPQAILLGASKNYEHMMEEMTKQLGRQPRLPSWAFDGMIFGIQDGIEVCDNKIDKLKAHNGAIAGIWCQDWEGQRRTAFGKQLFWDWIYDDKRYTDLPEKIKDWNETGIAFLGYINPFLAIEGQLYKEAMEKGYLVKNQLGDIYEVTITTFPAAMIDLTNPGCFKWMKDIIKRNMIDVGLKGWMADFGEYLPTDAVLYEGNAETMHNQWPALWAKLNREAVEEAGMLGQIIFFTRAGYTDTNKYSTLMWNGDQHVDWSRDYGMNSIVNSQLSLSAIGCGASHSDVGGYTGIGLLRRDKETLVRWAEMSCFSPVMRSHEGNKPENNHQFDTDEETLDMMARLSRIHKGLKPYLQSIDGIKEEKGLPMVRPLFFYYDEPFAYETVDSYLLGGDLLVSPTTIPGMITKEVTLPEDQWVHLWSGREYTGGTYRIGIPQGKPAVFYKKGSQFTDVFEGLKSL